MLNIKNIVLILLFLLISCSKNEKEYFFKYANEQPESSIRSQSMLFFKNQLETKTNGRIKVELFFSGVLGNERELMDLVATGVLQGTRGGFFADANPKFNLITLPFLVDGWDQALQLVNSPFMQKINIGARVRGFHIPATGISQGFRAHTNNVKPIQHPNDLKGLKMRVPMQEVYVQTALAFKANPQELPFIEVYHALQTGVVDGQDNAPSNIWDFKIYEVSDYLTISNYATGPDPFMVNLKWYESLPNDLQLIFDNTARETIAMSDKLNRKEESEFIEKLTQHLEVNYLTYDDLEPFRKAVVPVYQYFVDQGTFSFEEIDEARIAASK
ncbi:MAG: TRAP transporter substrate-binding protein [Candidatus Marinimicrobia bacterium]|jgi:C4-dicarboxylate-binding protein DctP|nr:TRAP transporter substrate-binding protein [Candidatus Neomarinimicrobiota bacterium]